MSSFNKSKCLFHWKNFVVNNTAEYDIGGIYISNHSTVIFNKSSIVTFTQNYAGFKGGTVFIENNSAILFDQNSTVMFNDNIAYLDGLIYSNINSSITFAASCKVTFNNNFGSAIHTCGSNITFMGSSVVIFSNNRHYDITVDSVYGYICFKENSSTMFYNNTGS